MSLLITIQPLMYYISWG